MVPRLTKLPWIPSEQQWLDILTVAAEGLTARQIGSKLGLRERTVTTHLGNIYKKLGAGGRMHAVAAATRVRLTYRPTLL